MSDVEDNFLDSVHKTNIVRAADDSVNSLKENPTPRKFKPWMNFLEAREREEESIASSFDKNQLRIGKKLVVSLSKEIGRGTDGTVVYEGSYEGRKVAVKRLLKTHIKLDDNEIGNLIASDHHQNVVRYYGVEHDRDFTYLVLELCDFSLDDLIRITSLNSSPYKLDPNYLYCGTSTMTMYENRWELLKNTLGDVKLRKENNDRPSPLLLQLLRDIVSGLVHLHKLGIIHRDLKPRNILITMRKSTLCAKLSDMGIHKRLLIENKTYSSVTSFGCATTSWKAAEQLLNGRHTSATDMFSLGCIIFFCITRGRHPFGDHDERDWNIKRDKKQDLFLIQDFPEAFHLISRLLEPDPTKRPKASEILQHPMFWDAEKRLSFLRDTSDRLGENSDLFKALERTVRTNLATKWNKKVDEKIVTYMRACSKRDYKFNSVRDLLRLIRNLSSHYGELGQDVQILVGPKYEEFDDYFTSRFPSLLIKVYEVVCSYYGDGEYFMRYFVGNPTSNVSSDITFVVDCQGK
ncbi:serine/threonine-protein kinase/endoribonuclease IRE1b isoform X1 [Morus notabilis]|uniref:serine/threonine-protein kinase/endoribonuclease IRE1b isoform X1 n=1 Tax=Morus notabilis TaxID=981085 RepID=UPI000CED6D28|nr:serine/threonine-protein kinase/endoribonuclease IRE1b isoform X1 [Morus notabilis]